MMPSGRAQRGAVLVAMAGAVIALDQLSKSWAQESLADGVPRHIIGPSNLVLTYNKGAAFSLGSGASPVIEALAVTLVVAVLWLSGRLAKGGGNLFTIAGFGLVSGGALSNLADRFLRHHHGAVVDFIQLVSWWPIFNVADAAITLGAVTIAVALLLSSGPGRPAPSAATSGPRAGLADPGSPGPEPRHSAGPAPADAADGEGTAGEGTAGEGTAGEGTAGRHFMAAGRRPAPARSRDGPRPGAEPGAGDGVP